MISPEDFARAWGPGLVRPSEAALAGVALPDASRRFLVDAGLPAQSDPLPFRFTFPPTGPPVLAAAMDGPIRPEIGDPSRLRVIGRDFLAFVCIDESAGGRIVNVKSSWTRPVRLLNSTVEQLAQFLLIFRAIRSEGAREEEEATGRLVAQAREHQQATEEARVAARVRRAEGLAAFRDAQDKDVTAGRESMEKLKAQLQAIDPGVFAQDNSVWLDWIDDMETMGGLR